NPPALPAANAPPPPSNAPPAVFPFAANFVENVHKLGLRVDRIMPIHGRIVPFKDVEAAVKTASSDWARRGAPVHEDRLCPTRSGTDRRRAGFSRSHTVKAALCFRLRAIALALRAER